jgi:hypothetical protein
MESWATIFRRKNSEPSIDQNKRQKITLKTRKRSSEEIRPLAIPKEREIYTEGNIYSNQTEPPKIIARASSGRKLAYPSLPQSMRRPMS